MLVRFCFYSFVLDSDTVSGIVKGCVLLGLLPSLDRKKQQNATRIFLPLSQKI
jgi:hypothetical protein